MRWVPASHLLLLSLALAGCGNSRTNPLITSPDSATFTVGRAGTFTVTATGNPRPGLTLTGALPAGITFSSSSAMLSGTPEAGSGGSYSLQITAHNGVLPDSIQGFTLTVQAPPAITSASSTTFVIGAPGSFSVQCTGFPVPSLSVSGALPPGVTFDPSAAKLSGTPLSGSSPSYAISFTASNGVLPDFAQAFTLTIVSPPTAPSNLRAVEVSSSEIDLSWTDNSPDVTGFIIERMGGTDSAYREIGTTAAGVTSYSDDGLLASTAYSYRVKARSAFADSPYSETADATTGPIRGLIELPRTGLTVSYAAGDDGDLQRGTPWPTPRFTNPDGSTPLTQDVIVDHLTGLFWTRDANTPGPSACGPRATKTWFDALLYISCLNSNAYLGYSDWRLPNRKEMTSLTNHYGIGSWSWLTSEGFIFVNAAYWTSTLDVAFGSSSYYVWRVYNAPGLIGNSAYKPFPVWPVRGTSLTIPRTGQLLNLKAGDDGDLQSGVAWPDPRFVDPDGTTPVTADVVVDRLTGLMWTRDANAPGPSACGSGAEKTWQGALDYVACLNVNNYAGYSDWVLPNMNELESLLNLGEASQVDWLNSQGFMNIHAYAYWSSTTDVLAATPFAWSIGMDDAAMGQTDKPIEIFVWPVRTNR